MGCLGKTKIKAFTKLTVVMCCQIVDRKSVAPSSSDRPHSRPVDKIRNFDQKKHLVKNQYASSAAEADFRGGVGVPQGIFNI